MNYFLENFGESFYRNGLNLQSRQYYDQILFQLRRNDYSGMISFDVQNGCLVPADCFAAYKAVRDDHPELFFLGNKSELIGTKNKGTFKYEILYSREMIQSVQYQLRKNIYDLVKGTAYLSVIDREILVYERVVKKLSYANHNIMADHNIVGPVINNSGVCDGINALLLLCLRRIGIPCIKVNGKGKNNEPHCWTIAWINGIPVHCDVTWDITEGDKQNICFNYFNLSDRQMCTSRCWSDNRLIPKCSCEELTYYRRKGLGVNSFAELIKKLEKDLSSKHLSLLHFNYFPRHGDFTAEIKKAFKKSNIFGSIDFYIYQDLCNALVIKSD